MALLRFQLEGELPELGNAEHEALLSAMVKSMGETLAKFQYANKVMFTLDTLNVEVGSVQFSQQDADAEALSNFPEA